MDMLSQGLIAAVTFLWLLSYFPIRRILGYAVFVDIIITATFLWMFSGSYAGMMTGVIAGMMVSVSLRIGLIFLRPQRLTFRRRKGRIIPSAVWRYTR